MDTIWTPDLIIIFVIFPIIPPLSAQPASFSHPQPQLSPGQRPSRGRGISRNVQWFCLASLFLHI